MIRQIKNSLFHSVFNILYKVNYMVTVKVKKEYFTLILIILFTVLLFRFPDEIKNGITRGLSICFYTIIPSMFPFLVL